MVEIRRCEPAEVGELMQFLERHWQAGHVLATHRELMDWQHRAADGRYNYLVARSKGGIQAVLGYIPSARFDPRLVDRNVLWLALWKVRSDSGVPGLGLRLLSALAGTEAHAATAVNGINLAHPPMYRALGYQVGELAQHVLVNPGRRQTLISAAPDWQPRQPAGDETSWTELGPADLEALPAEPVSAPEVLPAKTPIYFRERFLRHPFYRYRVFRLRSTANAGGLLALRIAEHEGRRALRIVDFAGDDAVLGSSGAALERLMQSTDAEYADLWSLGVAGGVIEASGFTRIDPAGATVVPNYFEPFDSRNARILCAFKRPTAGRFQAFRADGDQDRPNRLGDSP